jgi:hypothetical protein
MAAEKIPVLQPLIVTRSPSPSRIPSSPRPLDPSPPRFASRSPSSRIPLPLVVAREPKDKVVKSGDATWVVDARERWAPVPKSLAPTARDWNTRGPWSLSPHIITAAV